MAKLDTTGHGAYGSAFASLQFAPAHSWNTFMGGSGSDSNAGLAADDSGNVYVTGYSAAAWGSPLRAFGGGGDVFVAKYDATGALVWNTFLGGSGQDNKGDGGIVLDSSGHIYVVGFSDASWGSPLNAHSGLYDAFVAKLESAGSLLWHTFLGGSGNDYGMGIAVDGNANAMISGSSNGAWGFPKSPFAGSTDAFAAKLDSSGAFQWSTFLGGIRDDSGYAIATDDTGNAYVTGTSRATWGSPVNPFTLDGYNDVFVAKLDAAGNRLWNTFHTQYSGLNSQGFAVAVDRSGNIYVTGQGKYVYTSAFLKKFNSDGAYVTQKLLGDALHSVVGVGVVVDAFDNIYVSGRSNYSWGTPLNPFAGGAIDAFVAKFCSDFNLKWNTFLGGTGADNGSAIAVDESGNVYVAGNSDATWGAPLNAHAGDVDVFLAKIVDIPGSTITLTSPNGGESWSGATTENIVWTTTGTIANVRIEYSTNNGGTWTSVISSTPNDGPYSWTLPNAPSTQCRVKVSDAADACTSDASDSVFTILPAMMVISPNGGESWTMGSTQDITWTAVASIANVKIDYSTDRGTSWTTVIASTPNTGSFPWAVPYTPGTECLVRVSDTASGAIYDRSDDVFTLTQATITVHVPNGGSTYAAGSPLNIVWASTGSIVYVAIEYSLDNGASWIPIEASILNDGFYPWVVPAVSSDQCLVRIRDVADALVTDVSDSVFTMNSAASLVMAVPNGGETWTSGSARALLWSSYGAALASVKLEYSTTNGVIWQTIAASTPNDGSYDWTVPAVVSTQCLVRVSDAGDGFPLDVSDDSFTIKAPGVPLGGPWSGPTSRTELMSFDVSPDGNQWGNFELSAPITSGVGTIAKVAGPGFITGNAFTASYSNGTFTASGTFTSEGTASGTYDFNSFYVGPYGYLTQSGTWTATVPPLTVNSPNGGEVWEPGTVQNITWLALASVGDVKIEYSTNNGTTWKTIVASTPNDGLYDWTVPPTLSSVCKVRISEAADGDPSDVTDGQLSIMYSSDLGGALDNTALEWFTEGTGSLASWFAETTNAYFDGDAVQSGAIGHQQSSDLYTTVTGPGTLTFYWQVSSEANNDTLAFYIDHVNKDAISGEIPWAQKTFSVPAGKHQLWWCYSKNASAVAGSDCGWVDKVEFKRQVSISGTITAGGAGVANVMLNGLPGPPGTDSSGFYVARLDEGWSGTVTPSKSGVTFAPESRMYTNVTVDQITQDYAATVIVPPRIALTKSSLDFAAVTGGNPTSDQTVIVSNSGGGTLYWTASPSASWITLSADHGIGSGTVNIGVDIAGLSSGGYTGSVDFTGVDASNSPQRVAIRLAVYPAGATTVPFGDFATPIDGTTGITGAIPVTGWVLDDIETTRVEIWRDPVLSAGEVNSLYYIGDAIFVEGARPDVEADYPMRPLNYRAGWGYMLLTNFLPNQGNGTYKLYAKATDKEGNVVTLGTKTIVCDNAHAVKPFGTIDTPAQGGDASGNPFLNFGWVLTPLPKTVPMDGSTISVYVDSVLVGMLSTAPNVYNQYRVDVATNFPGLNNTSGPVGAFFLDTTAYANGVHTIYWIAYDDAGAGDGIGSRYFNIVNTGSAPELAGGFAVGGLPELESLRNVPAVFRPLEIRAGFSLRTESVPLSPSADGTYCVSIPEIERFELELGGFDISMADPPALDSYSGYLILGKELRPLPIGSTLDPRTGRFSWMPGPGFVGSYDLVFLAAGQGGIRKIPLKVTIVPKR